jgi:nucleoside-diphosphate-sugar epimerase/xanthosine utilization system XapX-like protein
MARVLVTGANGFIGSHLCELLLERGHQVAGLIRPTSDPRSLTPLFDRFPGRLVLVMGDLTRPQSLEAAVEGVEFVYHLAAKVMGTSEAEFRNANTTGVGNLLAALARRKGPGLKRFLYVSSQAAAGPSPSPQPIAATAPPNPVSWYGRSKRDAEELVRKAGLPATIVRPVAVYGERETDLSGGTFPVVAAGFAPRVGLGDKIVTMVYVGDLVRGMVEAAESPATVGRTYFLADPAPVPASLMIRAVADALQTRVRIPLIVPAFALAIGAHLAEWLHFFTRARPALTRDKVREVRQRYWAASPAAALADFGWQAKVGLEEGMRRAVADWRERLRRDGNLTAQPPRERAIQTYLLALGAGILTEGSSHLANLYHFHPAWFIVIAVLGFFGLIVGTISYVTAAWPKIAQFLVGAIAFLIVESANHYWAHLWEFEPEPLGKLDPWLRAGILSVPIGLEPVIIIAIVGAIYRKQLRLG